MRADLSNPWVGLSVVLSATFMAIMDVFITVVAAPSIRADLDASAPDLQLVLASYNLAFGLTLIIGGRFGDLFGRRRIFSMGLALFTTASLAASLAPGANALILARIILGAAAGFMTPQVFSIIQVTFEGERRARALAAFAVVSGIAATVAQIIGGLLIAADLFGLGWRSIFLVNVPVGLVALAAAQIWVSESRAPEADRHALDMIGVLLLLLLLGSLTAPLTLGAEQGWPSWSLASLALVPLLGGLLAGWLRRRQSTGRAPLVELSLLTKRRFVAGNLMAMLFYASNAALFVALPVFVQTGHGHSPLTSGLLFAPLALAFSATSAWAGHLTARHGYGLVAAGGLLLLAAYGCLALAASAGDLQNSVWPLLPGLILAGTGMGFVQPTISYTALEPVAPAEVGSASGVLNTSFELGYGLGSVLAGMFSFSAAGVAETFAGCLYLTSGLVILMMVTSYACRQPSLSPRTRRQWSADSA